MGLGIWLNKFIGHPNYLDDLGEVLSWLTTRGITLALSTSHFELPGFYPNVEPEPGRQDETYLV